jgi:hypothetical protein
MVKAYCETCGRYPDEVIVYPVIGETDDHELITDETGVIIYGDGTCSNRYADGTKGITPEVCAMAEDEDSAYCPECMNEITWQHAA